MNSDINIIIVNFRILSKMKPHDKISISTTYITLEKKSYYTSILRYFSNSNRYNSIDMLNNLVKDSHVILEKYNNPNDYYLILLKMALIESIKSNECGLRTMLVTYEDNTLILSMVEMIIFEIENLIEKINKMDKKVNNIGTGDIVDKDDSNSSDVINNKLANTINPSNIKAINNNSSQLNLIKNMKKDVT